MIVHIVTREEKGRMAVWPPFVNPDKAIGMVKSHIMFRAKNGAQVHRVVAFEPARVEPGTQVRVGGSEGNLVLFDAPECVGCVTYEAEIIAEDKTSRSIYRVTQHHVQE